MDDRKHPISPDTLYARLGSEAAPIIVDVRRDADFAAAATLVADAFHRSPDNVEQWRNDLPNGRQVVTYCVHGREVSQGVAAALRLMGAPNAAIPKKSTFDSRKLGREQRGCDDHVGADLA